MIEVPRDLNNVLNDAWEVARKVPGFLTESEARLLGTIAACTPGRGAIVEIGSFKGKSTVMLAMVAARYGLPPIVAIDPHNFNSAELHNLKADSEASTYKEFLENIEAAGVASSVEPRRAYSADLSPKWNRPIRFLWIDGDHSYSGAKADFDGFFPHVVPGGVVALHDALHAFAGPIRVFVEDMLQSNQFGAAGFVNSIAWSQFLPEDGARFQKRRASLARVAASLIPYVEDGRELTGWKKIQFKLMRSRVPRRALMPQEWVASLGVPAEK